ncbi:ABC transporter substrate-binding protein [Ehrlichia ruminantium]|uniref:ABC transporter substrate-binding protein n=1 Tax=Ehrlichia ruminantium TaxID=779 RepID=A0AAE6UI64_EHRRU|nr:ABC transporter substrate-binding protein [Ehrlichia ruminantium]QGR02135.1 ABC transporter substrate-binding protein [Ehrlichia ruminantium]QGR03055.1 ABC transporter substrate-binding protein [Ehrlichia ruminantium]QGR03980.1 ABC transporter substrate-binding protein [Ehrlichia ruminantium]
MNFVFRLFLIGALFIFNNAFGYSDVGACREYIKPCYFLIGLKDQIEIIVEDAPDRVSAYSNIQSVVERVLDIRDIAKFVMGAYWNSMSDDEHARFVDEYNKYIRRIYTKQLYKYAVYDMSIMSIKNPKENTYLINTRLSDMANVHNFVIVEFKLLVLGDKVLLSDIKINNAISFSINQRTVIKNMIDKKGIEGTISYFKEQNDSAK